jgi:tetratricopeptide (TPR) repeat protein
VLVSLLLAASFALAAFVSAAYKRDRQALGERHDRWGLWFQAHGEEARAIDEFRKALLFLPDNTQYRLSLAAALLSAGRLSEASGHLEQLVLEHPTDGVINLMLARVYLQENRTQAALQYYQRAVYGYWPASQLAERRQARWELVDALQKLGDRNSVIAELMQLYSNAPKNPAERAKIAFLLLQNGAVSEAAPIFHQLVHSWPHDAEAWRGLGQIAFTYGDYEAARRDFERAVHLNPSDEASSGALKLTNTVIRLDPGLPRITAAERLRRSGNLLNRVLDDIEQCSEGDQLSPLITQHVANAARLLSAKPGPEGGLAIAREDAAGQLWNERSSICPQNPPSDEIVSTVLARLGQ